MNPPPSSKSTKSLKRNCSNEIENRTKKQQPYRSPLNTTVVNSSSIETPKGCLRFFVSHSSSSSNSKTPLVDKPIKIKKIAKTTPKSAPNLSKTTNPRGEKVKKNGTFLYQWQSGKKPRSRNVSNCKMSSVMNRTSSSSVNNRLCDGNNVDLTPLTKIATGSGLGFAVDEKVVVGGDCGDEGKLSNGSGRKNKTPPVQASLSPEIPAQFGSSVTATSTTPACYGAGHVVSGITDKRKCRPIGLLIVGDNNVLDFGTAKSVDSSETGEENNEEKVVDKSRRVSIVPLPAEACMQWLLSPCTEEDEEHKENSENGSRQIQIRSPSSSLFGDEFIEDLCSNSSRRRIPVIANKRSSSLCSPCEVPDIQGISGAFHEKLVVSYSPNCSPIYKDVDIEDDRKGRYDFDGENSPISVDTLGSENVIQTPQSNSSSDRQSSLTQLKAEAGRKHNFHSEIDMLTEGIQMASLSSRGYESIWDPTSSSFQFDCMTTPSNSRDLCQLQKVLDDRASWISTSTWGNVSQSQMRISWREGLASRVFEMDEFDSCRYLSDEEEESGGCDNDHFKSCQKPELNVIEGDPNVLKNDFVSTEYVDTKTGVKEKGEERDPSKMRYSRADSISTDGGGLAASGDSDWSLCYKNHLFRVLVA